LPFIYFSLIIHRFFRGRERLGNVFFIYVFSAKKQEIIFCFVASRKKW